MANQYVTLTVSKLTGPNVHPDDDTLLIQKYDVTFFRVYGESGLSQFVNARHGTIGRDENYAQTVTITVTPKEFQKIKSASLYQG